MASKVSRNSIGRPATVEDVDDQGRPVSGTKKAATTNAHSAELRSDSGYSSHTGNTMAALASPNLAPRAPPRVPEPPQPVKADLPTPPAPQQRSLQDSSFSDTKPISASRPTHRQSYHEQQPIRPPQPIPQPCQDPNCKLPHYGYPPYPSQQQYMPSLERRYEPSPDYMVPTGGPLRRVRPMSYHEESSRGLDHLYARLGDGKSLDAPQTYSDTALREPTYPQAVALQTAMRPALRHTLTDTPRTAFVDRRDLYEDHSSYYTPLGIQTRRPSVHGESSTGSARSLHRSDRALTRQGDRSASALHDQLEARLTLRDHGHDRRHFSDPYQGTMFNNHGGGRRPQDYEYEEDRSRSDAFSNRARRRSRSPGRGHLETRSPRRASSPSRHIVSIYESDRLHDERSLSRSSHRDNSLEAQLLEAQRYMNKVRGGPSKDELAATMRNAHAPLYDSRPTRRRGSVSSSHKSHRSHGREHSHSRSSRRGSDFQVNVEVINAGERVQAFSMRADKPLTFTVDDEGVQHHSESRLERSSNTSSVMNWLSGGRSRTRSGDREEHRSSRRKMSIRSPIMEDRREGRR